MPNPGQTLKPLVKLGKSPDDCWRWLGAIDAHGFGRKTAQGRDLLAHRWVWENFFGPIPNGFVVYHRGCSTLDCVNPHHLACGFPADAKRNSVQTLLLPADVIEIRAAKADASPTLVKHLADKHGCSPQTIRDIWRGDSWGQRRRRKAPRRAECLA